VCTKRKSAADSGTAPGNVSVNPSVTLKLFEGGTTVSGGKLTVIPEGLAKPGTMDTPGEIITSDGGTLMSPLVRKVKLFSSTPRLS
jgi:hypothetical protein